MRFGFDKILGIHDDALRVHTQRVQVLATNLANIDTPNYKARDIDFARVLRESQKGQSPTMMAGTNPAHFKLVSIGSGDAPTKFRTPSQPALDGNTVDAHMERAEFAQEAVRFQATVQFLGRRFRGIINALKGE